MVNQMAHENINYIDMPYLIDDDIPNNIVHTVNNHLQARYHNPYVYIRRHYNGILTLAVAQQILNQ